MSDARLDNTIREHRDRLALSQQELAELVGVSRQAIIAIEGGRQVPSTSLGLRLAHALRCRMDDLFRLGAGEGLSVRLAPGGESEPGTRGRARVALGEVAGRWVAHRLPPDPARGADGILARTISGRTAVVRPLAAPDLLKNNVLVSGCAPLLGTLVQRLGWSRTPARATWLPGSSRHSLDLLKAGLVHVAGVHFSDHVGGEDNVQAVRSALPGQSLLVANLTRWRQGFVVAPGNPLGIATAADLVRPGVRVAWREEGAAAHELLSDLLDREDASRPRPAGPLASGHADVAQLVRSGAADVGVAIEGVALAAGLDFLPLTEERFDLVLPTELAGWTPATLLMEALEDPDFRAEASQLPGYDVGIAGQVTTLEAA